MAATRQTAETGQLALPMDRESRLDREFRAFHAANPHVYDALVAKAREAKAAGLSRYGVKALFEVIRYDHRVRTRGADWKLDNCLTSRYARLIMEQEPDLQGFFELRRLRDEVVDGFTGGAA